MIKELSQYGPGRLDVKITIEQPTLAKNSIGENETTWSTYKTKHCERVFKPRDEQFEASQPVASERMELKTRYDVGITAIMRFYQSADTTYFYIRSVSHLKREGLTIIHAERRNSDV
jgi:head-tail adaptor